MALPTLYQGSGAFTFPNGDIYDGEYIAHRNGILWREGFGVYTTHDGQIYSGYWKDDKLLENKEINITYVNGAEYCGNLTKNKYRGPGVYKLENDLKLSCQFLDNQPVGDILLMDATDHIWVGKAEKNNAMLFHENIFYNSLCNEKGIGTLKVKPKFKTLKRIKRNKLFEKTILTESKIFGKSNKTTNDIDLTDSKWYQNYMKFKTTRNNIKAKIEEQGEDNLDTNERDWWNRYQIYKENRIKEKLKEKEKITETPPVDATLLQQYYSKEFEKSCPPVKVFYPSTDWDEFYDPDKMPEKFYVDNFESTTSLETVKRLFKIYENGGKYDANVGENDLELVCDEESPNPQID